MPEKMSQGQNPYASKYAISKKPVTFPKIFFFTGRPQETFAFCFHFGYFVKNKKSQ
jgi:hypothetical protein